MKAASGFGLLNSERWQMTIGIVAAMQCEIDGIRQKLEDEKIKIIGAFEFHVGRVSGHTVIIIVSGIGLVNAALATQMLISNFTVDLVINPGVAGALSEKLNVCDIVISKDSTYWDFDVRQLTTSFPFMRDHYFPADEKLYRLCISVCSECALPNKLYLGRVVSGQRFLSDLEIKKRLCADFGADCVEMEGAAVAHACFLGKVPYLIIRCISDCLNDNGLNAGLSFRKFLGQASLQLGKVLEKLIGAL
jgi:adenosylhomocysteine nucleosidase